LFKVLGQSLLQESADLLALCTMTIADREEVAVLQMAEVRNSNPYVLINFVGVARTYASLCREGKLGHAVRPHLPWISRRKGKWLRHNLSFLLLLSALVG
jgi:hypothetical protein